MTPPPKNTAEVKAVATSNQEFTFDLFKQLQTRWEQGNLVYSPFSLHVVVAMLQMGAKGQTYSEIQQVFHYPSKAETLSKGYKEVLSSLQSSEGKNILQTANRLYLHPRYEINPIYASTVKDNFFAEIKHLDFDKTSASVSEINGWVKEKTKGKIKDMCSPNDLEGEVMLVVINAIYFKGLWKYPFNKKDTKKAPFFLGNLKNNEVQVDMMSGTISVPYVALEGSGVHAVALPFKGDRLWMVLVAPLEINKGISSVDEGLRAMQLLLKKVKEEEKSRIMVRIPRFTIESTLPLVPVLKNMGAIQMFARTANFSGIPVKANGELFVSQIKQKAFIEVNEEGAEAAAASAAPMAESITPSFNADRPFVFHIVDSHTNFVLFGGRCADPTKTV